MDSSGDPRAYVDTAWLIGLVRGRSDRKLRLVACALCRVIWDELSDLSRRAVVFAEGFADGCGTPGARREHFDQLRAAGGSNVLHRELWLPACMVVDTGQSAADFAVGAGVPPAAEVAIIHDIFAAAFHPVRFAAEWRTSTVRALAQQMYESHDFSPMPILADALQDAGCDSSAVLNHCRDMNPTHVRGCWVVDAVLEKV